MANQVQQSPATSFQQTLGRLVARSCRGVVHVPRRDQRHRYFNQEQPGHDVHLEQIRQRLGNHQCY